MRKSRITLAVSILIFASCGDPAKPLEDGKITSTQELEAATNQFQAAYDESQSRRAERVKRGDTLAMPYKDLQAFFPESFEGYTKSGEPRGSQINMPGMGSWSETTQEYSDNDKTITIKILDYNAAESALSGLTALYSLGFKTENDERTEGGVDIGMEGVTAYETVYKKMPESSLVLVVADRFFINLENTGNEDHAILRKAVQAMDINSLLSK